MILFITHLAAPLIVTMILGVLYVSVQQNYRSGANDPQLQIARDIDENIGRGVSVHRYLSDSIDLGKSLSAFVTLYNEKGQPVQSSGFLGGEYPHLPAGVFEFAKSHGEDVLTWQPRPGVRMATVVLYISKPSIGYIVVGRSLQEVEIREQNLRMMVFVCWVIAMASIAVVGLLQFISREKKF